MIVLTCRVILFAPSDNSPLATSTKSWVKAKFDQMKTSKQLSESLGDLPFVFHMGCISKGSCLFKFERIIRSIAAIISVMCDQTETPSVQSLILSKLLPISFESSFLLSLKFAAILQAK